MGAGVGPTRTKEFVDSSELLDDPERLRARAAEYGYLFFRSLLPAEPILEVRRRVLEVVGRHSWLADGSDPMAGLADVEAYERTDPAETAFCGVGVTPDAYADIQRLREFHELAHHPRLLALYRVLFGGEVFPHPRNIARVMIPGRMVRPTPAHQDYIHIQGTPNVWTAWVPLGACPMDLGGLEILERSHKDGVLSYKESQGAGGLEAYLCDLDLVWARGDYHVGDVVTFSSRTVHRALPNQTGDRVRLSCDFRYQRLDEEINDRSLQVHCGVLSWEDVYADWPENGIQWYWRGHALDHAEWDESVRWQKDKIC